MDFTKLPLDDEIRLFDDFVKSPIWQLLQFRWAPIVSTSIGATLSGKVSGSERDFLAGKANGLKHFLEYPEKHLKMLEMKLKNEQDKAKSKFG